MLVGIGIDLVAIARFKKTIERTPKLIDRLFAPSESTLTVRSLAARFAAKEALIKAFGDSDGLSWQDIVIAKTTSGKPFFENSPALVAKKARHGCTNIHLSLSHDGDNAIAFVILEAGK